MVNTLKVLAAVVALLIIIGLGMLGKKVVRVLIFKTAKTHSNESIVLEFITGAVTAGIAIAYYTSKQPIADAFMWTGIIVFFLGGILQLIARKQLYEEKTFEERLSASFAAAQTGLYSKIRHPNKSALLLMMLGFCLAMGSIWGLALTIILFLPSVLYRISQEERTLLDKFGDRWMSYKDDTKRLIPGIL